MSLDQLLHEVTVHYRSRGFPESALTHLRWMLVTSTKHDMIQLATAYSNYRRSVAELLGYFKSCPKQSKADISTATAVFGFAFGYEMTGWTEGKSPTEDSEVKKNRKPGENNIALAKMAEDLHGPNGSRPLYLQFEISEAIKAINKQVRVEFASSPKDQGTAAVADEFIAHALSTNAKVGTVVLLAHQHHYERCRIILEKKGIKGLPTDTPYPYYDELEAQPRVMSAKEFIVSDFVSMAAMCRTA
jgi:hypothetical protein